MTMTSEFLKSVFNRTTVPATAFVLAAAGSVHAAPFVDGMTITMPDDGWYQVQSSSTYQQICAGVRSCDVEAGTYIVINHTTGERFENVVVEDAAGSGDIVVSDNTISWPDDGWYQVQDSATYESLCQGGSSCSVQPGNYIVINHTTGERFENVVVEGAAGGGGIVVSDNTISWPDDGWYQVQDSATYESLCQGGSSCSVQPGNYIVINHTSGERWTNVVVTGEGSGNTVSSPVTDLRYERYSSSAIELFWNHPDDGAPAAGYTVFQDGVSIGDINGRSLFIEGLPDDRQYLFDIRIKGESEGTQITVDAVNDEGGITDDVLSVANAESIVANVVGVINEEAIDALYETAADDQLARDKVVYISDAGDAIEFVGEGDTSYVMEQGYDGEEYGEAAHYFEYACVAGGGLNRYHGESNYTDLVFDDCVVGTNTYNGTAASRAVPVRGVLQTYPVYDFSITDSNGEVRKISGAYSSGNLSFAVTRYEQHWKDAEYSGPYEEGLERIDDYSVSRMTQDGYTEANRGLGTASDGTSLYVYSYSHSNVVNGSFNVEAPWSQDNTLSVDVNLAFNDDVVFAEEVDTGNVVEYVDDDPKEEHYWQSGSIEITAEDGSKLTVAPVAGSRDTFLVTTGNGETVGPFRWDQGYTLKP